MIFNLPHEEWRVVPDIAPYQISNLGRLRRGGDSDQLIIPSTTPRGYKVFTCCGKTRNLHVVVLETFTGPRPSGKWACHNDGNQANNCLSNLRWDTPAGNFQDRDNHGNTSRGSHRPTAKLTESDVEDIRRISQDGIKSTHIAKLFSVHPTTIYRILSGKSWQHVSRPVF